VDRVRGVSLDVRAGETVGLVGESGSGKTTLALAAIRCLPPAARVTAGTVRLAGADVAALDGRALRRLWRDEVGLVPQNPRTALNPTLMIGAQVAEALPSGPSRADRAGRITALLESVRLADPSRVAERYPHQLSGGMLQRVMIAMALCRSPALLVLDEPTTALDVTTEAVILDLIRDLVRGRDTAVLYITHNLGVVAELCDRVVVLHAGERVEDGPTAAVFRHPRHPYTRRLLASAPRLGRGRDHDAGEGNDGRDNLSGAPGDGGDVHHVGAGPGDGDDHPESSDHGDDHPESADHGDGLRIVELSKTFPLRSSLARYLLRRPPQSVRAVADVDLALPRGRTIGLVGESGSGKRRPLARAPGRARPRDDPPLADGAPTPGGRPQPVPDGRPDARAGAAETGRRRGGGSGGRGPPAP